MSRYDFTSLSSQDFEELTRDLLQAEWGVALEAFKAGRDSGIDLRYAPADGGKTVVQCKHYAVSGFNKLLSHLRDIERPKVERLSPDRYVVVTSVGLTPGNKDDLFNALKPFVLSASDIFAADDIEGLLSRHPDIERTNFKLWLTSISVIERVLHNAEICHTQFQVERIRRKLPLFVQSGAFPRAMQLLDETRIVVISGVPGIGKTTLAEILLYAYLEQGYEPVVIQGEIAEGRKLFKQGAKQVFYYDDFLGQTFLRDRSEYLGRNQDSALIDFMEMVIRSEHARFILTTREHILSAALQASERFVHSLMLGHRCVLELRDYTFGDKSRMLYNHLYFCGLPQSYKEAVLQDAFFLKIIKHEHFNPRLIEWLSTQARLGDVGPSEYQSHISALLDSPEKIWSHAFQRQISDAARCVLLSFYTLGEWIEAVDLEPAFISLHRHSADKYHRHTAPGDFRNALQELDGAFLTYSSSRVSFLNPSVREFVAAVICGDPEIARDLLVAAARFKQLVKLQQLSEAHPNSALQEVFMSEYDLVSASLSRLLYGPSMRWAKMVDGSQRGYYIDMEDEGKIGFLMELASAQRSPPLVVTGQQLADVLVAKWNHATPDFPAMLSLLADIGSDNWVLEHGGREIHRKLVDGMLENLLLAGGSDWLQLLEFPGKAIEWTEANETALSSALERYKKRGVREERHDCTTLAEMTELRESLSTLATKYGFDFNRDIEQLDEDIMDREESPERPRSGGSNRVSMSPAPTYGHIVSDEDVQEMFSTLREGS